MQRSLSFALGFIAALPYLFIVVEVWAYRIRFCHPPIGRATFVQQTSVRVIRQVSGSGGEGKSVRVRSMHLSDAAVQEIFRDVVLEGASL